MNHYQINSLLYGTSSIFYNKGLSIYRVQKPKVPIHSLDFSENNNSLDKVHLTSIEDYLSQMVDEKVKRTVSDMLDDAADTVQRYVHSAARLGVLFSHKNLVDPMRPHVHRHAYSKEILPCISIHYKLGDFKSAESAFEYYDYVDVETVRRKDLCDNQNILKWCESRPKRRLPLTKDKNIILFDSATTPHNAFHTDGLEAYIIFDNVKLREPLDFQGPTLLS